jgi:hypothetical protein
MEGSVDSPVSAIAQHGDDGLSLALLLGQLGGSDDVESTRCSDVQPLLVQQSVDHLYGFGIGDMQSASQEGEVRGEVGSDTSLSDT